ARESFAIAVERQPEFEEARIGLARTLIDLHQPEKALPQLKAALQLNSGNEVSHFQLSRAYRALGKTAEQHKELQEVQRLSRQKRGQYKSLFDASFNPGDVTRQSADDDTP